MPTIFTHAVFGYGCGNLTLSPPRASDLPAGEANRFLLLAAVAPVIPDGDALLMRWIPYEHVFGHRGFSHSIAFALLMGIVLALALRRARSWFPGGLPGLALFFAVLTFSNPLLDALTDGGLGVAFFAPFSSRRCFLPWALIPVAPIAPSGMFHWGFLRVIGVEMWLFWTAALGVVLWRWPRAGRWHKLLAVILLLACAAGWVSRLTLGAA